MPYRSSKSLLSGIWSHVMNIESGAHIHRSIHLSSANLASRERRKDTPLLGVLKGIYLSVI